MPPRSRPLARGARLLLALPLVLLLAPPAARAVPPLGSFAIDLGGSQSVWLDVNGGANQFCDGFAEGFGATPDACDVSMFVDAGGRITGSLSVSATNGSLGVQLAGPITGSLKGDSRSGLTGLLFSLKLSGQASDGASTSSLKGSVNFDGDIDGDGNLTGAWTTQLCAKPAGCVGEKNAPAPAEMLDGGDWMLVLQIADLGRGSLGGDASAVLADGTLCPYAIRGKYNAKSDTASLRLSASNALCKKTSISLQNVRLDGTLTGVMRYRLFGAQGSAQVQSVSP